MGFVFSKSMNDSLKAQQEFMLMNSRLQGIDIKKPKLSPVKFLPSFVMHVEESKPPSFVVNGTPPTQYYAAPSSSPPGPFPDNSVCMLVTEPSRHYNYYKLPSLYCTLVAYNGGVNLERQLLMQNQMRERQTAMQIAWTREFLKYFGTFFGLAAVGLTAGAIKKKNPGVLLPIVPLSLIFAYQYDMGYGTLLQRIKGEAENILDTQSTLLELPKGPLTYEDLEKIRRSQSKFFIEK